MKILFAIKTLENSVGGAERVTSDIASAMAELGHDVGMLTFDRPEATYFYPLDARIRRLHIPSKNTARKTGLGELPALLLKLRQCVAGFKPDIIVCSMHSMFIPMQLALLGSGIKIIFSEHTVPEYYKGKRLEFIALTLTGLMADCLTIVSPHIKKLYPRVLQPKMHVLPNPIFSDFSKADVTAADKNAKTILTVGRLDALKHHSILIDAFALLVPQFPEWELNIIGEGTERKNLEVLIKQHNLSHKIHLSGVTRDINAEYRKAHIFAMPSRYESFGLVTAEAMSHGLPVIGFTDCSGTNELIDDGQNGFLIQNRRCEDLAAGLKKLMEKPDLRENFAAISYEKAQKYSRDTIMAQWERFITSRMR